MLKFIFTHYTDIHHRRLLPLLISNSVCISIKYLKILARRLVGCGHYQHYPIDKQLINFRPQDKYCLKFQHNLPQTNVVWSPQTARYWFVPQICLPFPCCLFFTFVSKIVAKPTYRQMQTTSLWMRLCYNGMISINLTLKESRKSKNKIKSRKYFQSIVYSGKYSSLDSVPHLLVSKV